MKADDQAAQYSDPSPALTAQIAGYVNGDTVALLGGALTVTTNRTVNSPAANYVITPAGLTSANYAIAFVPGTFTVKQEDATLSYTGDTLDATGSTSTSSTAKVTLSAAVTEFADGSLGNQLGNQSVLFIVRDANTTEKTRCTSTITVPTSYAGSGTASCTVNVPADTYFVDMTLVSNGYYFAPLENGTVTVVLSGTGFVTGGGWIKPNLGTRSNFGFTVKYLKNGNVQGNSLYIYRKTVVANTILIPGTTSSYLPADDYNWIIKSNSMTGLTQKCPTTGTTVGCTATFTGKSTITAENRRTGTQYGLGGNNSFQVDVTDNGEPGSSASTTPDTYALRVWDASGTYYQLGTPTSQLALNGGNIQVHL